MRGRLLAALVLSVAITSLTRADYIVIIANLHGRSDGGTGTGGATGAGGLAGGGSGEGGTGMGGLPGMGGPAGGRGGMGMIGGGPPGMAGMTPPGMAGGPPGMIGGGPGGSGEGGSEDASDDASYIIVSVLEVGELSSSKLKNFEAGALDQHGMPFSHRWGKSNLKHKTGIYEVVPLRSGNNQLLHSVVRRFGARKDALGAGATTAQRIELSRWALENGLLSEFVKEMDKLAEGEESKNDPIVKSYLKTKADLERPTSKNDLASEWKAKLLENYRVRDVLPKGDKLAAEPKEATKELSTAPGKSTGHFSLIHNHGLDTIDELKPLEERLEKSFKSFYYWWALRGLNLKVPTDRQVVILTEKTEDFNRLQKHLTASPLVADSFFARREGLSVFAGKRNDDSYATLERLAKPYWERGYVRNELLRGSIKSGIPKQLQVAYGRQMATGQPIEEFDNARLFALLLKTMEEEWEATGTSHQVSRQLVYSSGLLPRNVHAPEWLTFGLGSFFEVPLQSPFGGPGAASPYWLPRFRESYKAKHYNQDKTAANPSAYDALVRVVTEAGFRSRPEPTPPQPEDTPQMADHRAKEAHQRRARAAAWALVYFLTQNPENHDGMQRFLKELSRMPRDLDLDDKVLLACFARSFDCVNVDKTVNKARLTALAERWIKYIQNTPIEAETVHKQIREFHKRVTRVQPSSQQQGGGRPGFGPAGGGRP